MSIGRVKVNDDITAFLPADTDTRRGLTVMEEEFVTYADAKVMLANTTYERAEAVAEEIRALEHVTGVELDDSPAHFVNSAALLTVSFDTEADDPRAGGRAALRAVGRLGYHSRRGGISAASAEEETARPRGKRRAGRISKIPHMTMPLRMKIRRGNSFKC